MRLKLFALMFLSTIIFLTGCAKEDSPEAALKEMTIALAERDSAKLSGRVDLDEFFSETYDATTMELAKNYDAFKNKYPDDPYFQHTADFLVDYNTEHKARHLKFLDDVKDAYFAKLPEPDVPEENPAAYVANEFEKIRQSTLVTLKDAHVDGDKATVTLDVRGDNSLRGYFIGRLTFKLAFHRDEKNHWQFDAIENLDELMPTLVDKAELVWITFF